MVRRAKELKSEDTEGALSTVILAKRWGRNSRTLASKSMEPPPTHTSAQVL
jgi:hypothetical protein